MCWPSTWSIWMPKSTKLSRFRGRPMRSSNILTSCLGESSRPFRRCVLALVSDHGFVAVSKTVHPAVGTVTPFWVTAANSMEASELERLSQIRRAVSDGRFPRPNGTVSGRACQSRRRHLNRRTVLCSRPSLSRRHMASLTKSARTVCGRTPQLSVCVSVWGPESSARLPEISILTFIRGFGPSRWESSGFH